MFITTCVFNQKFNLKLIWYVGGGGGGCKEKLLIDVFGN
jgi:hypothetical protein